ncbi:MAG: DUF885 domain-containing protein [Lachnospiraceae bacterium]|nr:DUF885 domain-containing protein [Lachnospiraceae bacterium]
MLNSHFPKKALALFLLLPILLFVTLFLFPLENFSNERFSIENLSMDSDSRNFTALCETIFEEGMSGNTLNLHYILAQPEDYGIAHYPPVLPCYQADSGQASLQRLDDYIEALEKIDVKHLSEDQQYTYALLSRFLAQSREGSFFAYYDEPLAPSSGMQAELPILLAEYTFRSKTDVEDYLALLDQTDEYFASLLLYEQEKKEAGLLQADTSLLQVCEQCYSILSKAELANGTHFLQITFGERLETLLAEGIITKEEAIKYISLNDRLLTTVMQPAYENLADGLFLLMEDGTSRPTGLSSLPRGKEYYTWLVGRNTGSALTMEEIKALLYPHFEQTYSRLHDLLKEENAIELWLLNQDTFPNLSPEEILDDLKNRMDEDFPDFPGTFLLPSPDPGLLVKTVSPSLQDYCAPAFYLTPPLDDPENNVIYINEKSTPQGLELYTTLAHEGYPGHLYQAVYSQRTMQQQNGAPVRQLLWYGGYLEGWALYVEFLSYDYAAAFATEQGDTDAAFAYTIEKHNRDMQLCLYALLDISIHYDGAPYEQVQEVLNVFGITDADTTRRIYDYIAEEPSNYLKYYLGYLELLRLKDTARTRWGNDYSDLRFHTFLLDCGPSDFTTLQEALAQTS